MTLLALVLLIVAAFAHASWNLLAKRTAGDLVFVWLVGVVATVIYAPLAALALLWERPSLGPAELLFIGVSALLHVGYFLFLQRGYRTGELSLVYPMARGLGPMLAMVLAIVLLGERPTLPALLGGLLIVGSAFVLTGGPRVLRSPGAREAVLYAVLTGVSIAAYTLWDKVAVSTLLIPPLFYQWSNNLGRSLLLAPWVLHQRREILRQWKAYRWETLGVAVLMPLAYLLVLTALVFTPVSYVAPAREISILIGTFLGTHLLMEGHSLRRLTAAGGMVLGVAVLAIS